MRAALVQMTSSDDPSENRDKLSHFIDEAADQGARFVLSPEVSNCVSMSRRHQNAVLAEESADVMLRATTGIAKERGVWVLLGSLALKEPNGDGRFVNRSLLIDDTGAIRARYDKIHMFDVDVSTEESYRESDGYKPGDRAVCAKTPFAKIGMSICYDLRFAYLFRALAKAGAQVLTVPSAFSPATGKMHWQTLLQARAIETGCFVLAPAQTGTHPCQTGKSRRTYGHSLAIAPWGEILLDGGDAEGVNFVDLDMQRVEDARRRVPAITHDRQFEGPA
jgi:predicted amidohydrolase